MSYCCFSLLRMQWNGIILPCRMGLCGVDGPWPWTVVWWGEKYCEFIAGFGNYCQRLSPTLSSVLSFISLFVPIMFAWRPQHGCDPLKVPNWARLPWAVLQPRWVCTFSRKAVLWWLCFQSMEKSRRVVMQWKEIAVSWLTPSNTVESLAVSPVGDLVRSHTCGSRDAMFGFKRLVLALIPYILPLHWHAICIGNSV